MDIKWKDDYGNILNATNDLLKFKNVDGTLYKLSSEDIHMVEIKEGMLFFYDKEEKSLLDIDIPEKKMKEAVSLFNEYDKTGRVYKGKTGFTFIDFMNELLSTGDMFTNTIIFGTLIVTFALIYVGIFAGGADLQSKLIFLGIPTIIAILKIFKTLQRKSKKQ